MSKTEQDKSYFLAFCIEQYKVVKGMDGADVAHLFFEKGVASYLLDNFEVLHTQSPNGSWRKLMTCSRFTTLLISYSFTLQRL